MSDKKQPEIADLNPNHPTRITESGEIERPQLRRKIDCGGNPEVADRRMMSRGGRRRIDAPRS